jgi:hypothetical protein
MGAARLFASLTPAEDVRGAMSHAAPANTATNAANQNHMRSPLMRRVRLNVARCAALVKARAAIYVGGRMKYISIRAVVLATLAVIGVDILSGLVLASVFAGPGLDAAATDAELKAVAAELAKDSGYLISALILGTASTVLGGYLAARIARTLPYYNALAFGLLGVLLGLFTSGDFPLWFRVVGLGLTAPAALLGGHIAKTRFGPRRDLR